MTKLIFEGCDQPTLGVEIELQILDPDSFDLIPQSEKLLNLCKKKGLERVKAEVHQSMLEIDSEISSNVKECRRFLESRLVQLQAIAEDSQLELGITGTHPFQRWKDRRVSNIDRYQFLHEKFQWLVRRMNVYGLHVHVGMPSKECALAVSQTMIQYLPLLLALSANSPFWEGIDTGMQSSRISAIETFPFAGVPPWFSKWEEFEYYYNTLLQNGAINSLKDLYWYIRPNTAFGTIEFRICDAMSTLSETMSLVALTHCLAVEAIEDWSSSVDEKKLGAPECHWIAPHNQWIAARDGMEGIIITDFHGKQERISEVILKLLDQLASTAERLNCSEELNGLNKIIQEGNGAQRQRAVYEKSGSLRDVVAFASKEFKDDLSGLSTADKNLVSRFF